MTGRSPALLLGLLLLLAGAPAGSARGTGDGRVSPAVALPRTERMLLAARLRPVVYRILGVPVDARGPARDWAERTLRRRIDELILAGQARWLLRR